MLLMSSLVFFYTRFYQMDKTCLQDHVGKIRAALCDKGECVSFQHYPVNQYIQTFCFLFLLARAIFLHRSMRDVRDAAAVPGDDPGRRERLQGPRALLREHPQAGDGPPPAPGLRLPPHPLPVDPGTLVV